LINDIISVNDFHLILKNVAVRVNWLFRRLISQRSIVQFDDGKRCFDRPRDKQISNLLRAATDGTCE